MLRWVSKGWESREEAGRVFRWWCRFDIGVGDGGGGRVGRKSFRWLRSFRKVLVRLVEIF